MNIFGVGTSEIMVLALAALLIFGPGKLPEVMGQAGKWVRQFREMTAEYQGDFQKTIAEAKTAMDDITKELGPMQQQVNSITSSVKKDLGGVTSTASSGASTSTKAEPAKVSGTATSRSANRTTTASKSTSTTSTTSTSSSTSESTTTASTVATKDEPTVNVSLFEQPERPTRRRARSATPSSITDRASRGDEDDYEQAMAAPDASSGSTDSDALARVRRRRQAAGYNHARAV